MRTTRHWPHSLVLCLRGVYPPGGLPSRGSALPEGQTPPPPSQEDIDLIMAMLYSVAKS